MKTALSEQKRKIKELEAELAMYKKIEKGLKVLKKVGVILMLLGFIVSIAYLFSVYA